MIRQIGNQRGHALVQFRQLPAHDLEVVLVRVPTVVVDGDVLDALLDQPASDQARLPEGVAAVAVREFVLLLGQIEDLARVAEDQIVGLLLGLLGRCHLRIVAMDRRSVLSFSSNSRRCLLLLVGDARGDDPLDGEPVRIGVAARGKRFVADPQETGFREPALGLGEHDVGRNQALRCPPAKPLKAVTTAPTAG